MLSRVIDLFPSSMTAKVLPPMKTIPSTSAKFDKEILRMYAPAVVYS